MSKQQIGIIGFGTFGRFMYQHLIPYFDIVVYDTSPKDEGLDVTFVSLEEVAKQKAVIIAIPVQKQEAFIKKFAKAVNPQALVFDVSSVKTKPTDMMQRYLPASCGIVATHPLFGPQSGKNGITGLTIVLWPIRVEPDVYKTLKEFLKEELKLKIIERSPQEHDREMAYVQALTFFIGRALGKLDIPDLELKTATYQHLLDVKHIVNGDTDDLFYTIQHENPLADDIREALLQHLHDIEDDLQKRRR